MDGTRRHYVLLTLALSGTAFVGFSFTYFGPLFAGAYPDVSPTVHLHGWSFFLWYLLLPLQAGLIGARRLELHRRLGTLSAALATVMVATGLVVATVRIHRALPEDGSPFWRDYGPMILATLVIFTVFYGVAMAARRTDRQLHKRSMVVASAGALGAAGFRIFMEIAGFTWWVPVAGVVATSIFVLGGMAYDHLVEGRVHKVYVWGLGSIVATGLVYPLTISPAGPVLRRGLGAVGALLETFY